MASILDPNQGASVHQLIMGSGKTTVVAPLLALMLPDTKATGYQGNDKTIVVQVLYMMLMFSGPRHDP